MGSELWHAGHPKPTPEGQPTSQGVAVTGQRGRASRERERIEARVKETADQFNITRDLTNYTLLMLVEGCWCLHCQQLMGLAREAMKVNEP